MDNRENVLERVTPHTVNSKTLWEFADFSNGAKRTIIDHDSLTEIGFVTETHAITRTTTYSFMLSEERVIVLTDTFDTHSGALFQDAQYFLPKEKVSRRFRFMDQLETFMLWAASVPLSEYKREDVMNV